MNNQAKLTRLPPILPPEVWLYILDHLEDITMGEDDLLAIFHLWKEVRVVNHFFNKKVISIFMKTLRKMEICTLDSMLIIPLHS